MKISIMSDLHIEFDGIKLPGGDVIVLAGDIFVADRMLEDRVDAYAVMLREKFVKFAKKELSKYRRGVMVLGNHEFYNSDLMSTPQIVRNFLQDHAPHISLLDNQTEVIDGVPFIGSTLWAPCGHGNPVDEVNIQRGMNDFRSIHTGVFREELITPALIGKKHSDNVRWLEYTLAANTGSPCVVVTHHAPSLMANGTGGHAHGCMDSAYASNLHALIEANPNIAVWAYGHTHNPMRLRIGEHKTLVISNPRGYAGYERISNEFDATSADFELHRTPSDRRGDGGDNFLLPA